MAISRYSFVNKYRLTNNVFYGTSSYNTNISNAISNGTIDCYTHVVASGERLDQISYNYYNDSKYWWIIAAASRVGWPLQVPAGTILLVPKNLSTALGVAS